MRILLVHNYYQQPGGENVIFDAEAALLRAHNHEVEEYTENNQRIDQLHPLSTGVRTFWSRQSHEIISRMLVKKRPDIVHFHNTFPLISPSAYAACRTAKIPVVQTLYNYRLLCPAVTFFRDGKVCEECMGKSMPWPGVVHSCYRGSYTQSAVTAGMIAVHGLLKTWHRQVDVYIALTEFSRRKFIQGGLPGDKIMVKPTFVSSDVGAEDQTGEYILFIGRFTHEKGIRTLCQAWSKLQHIPLKVVGDGPLKDAVKDLGERGRSGWVEVLGWQDNRQILQLLKRARALIFPSEWYETFGRVAIEAFSCGVPVVASRLGAMSEVVRDGHTGLHFNPGEAGDLAEKILWAWEHPQAMCRMGKAARAEYEQKYTASRNHEMLMNIYQKAMELGPQGQTG